MGMPEPTLKTSTGKQTNPLPGCPLESPSHWRSSARAVPASSLKTGRGWQTSFCSPGYQGRLPPGSWLHVAGGCSSHPFWNTDCKGSPLWEWAALSLLQKSPVILQPGSTESYRLLAGKWLSALLACKPPKWQFPPQALDQAAAVRTKQAPSTLQIPVTPREGGKSVFWAMVSTEFASLCPWAQSLSTPSSSQ